MNPNVIAPALDVGKSDGLAVCQSIALRGRDGGATAELGDDLAFALRASGGGDKPHVLTHAIQAGALRENPNSGPDGVGVQADISYTLEARAEVQAVQFNSAVRRLTPRECERLQGFQWRCASDHPGAWQDHSGRWWSPDYTAIPYGHVSKAKLDADYVKYLARGNPKHLTREDVAGLASDGPRYKALGNSWAVPKFHWLGQRLDRALAAQADPLALAIERYRRQRAALLALAALVPAA
jgi:DNA (cytosine-5)-methyltransferase 1